MTHADTQPVTIGTMQGKEVSRPSLKPLVVILFSLIVAFHVGFALKGKSLRRFLHLGTALTYAHGPIDLLRPIIIGYNANGTPTAQELPVWQAAVGLMFKATGSTWYGWANIVSLLLFSTSLWPFLQFARQYVGERAAWWSLAFFLAAPLIVQQAGEAATDGFCLTVSIWFVFFADRMIRSGQFLWWIPTALFGALSAVSKLPFFLAAGLCTISLLWANDIRTWKPWLLLTTAGIFACGIFLAWTHYVNGLYDQALYPFVDLRLAHNPWLKNWYFGDIHIRLSPAEWTRAAWRVLHGTVGSLSLSILLIVSLLYPGNRLPKLWLLGTLLTTLLFTHLVFTHWHYYLMCCPATALLCGAIWTRWEPFWLQQLPRPWLWAPLAGTMLVFSAIDTLTLMKIHTEYDPSPEKLGQTIREHTTPEDKLIVYGIGAAWGGEELHSAGRNGFYVGGVDGHPGGGSTIGLRDLLESETDLARLKSLGYNKLVLFSETPEAVLARSSLSTRANYRLLYPKSISQKVDVWPVVYQSEDIMIKDIP